MKKRNDIPNLCIDEFKINKFENLLHFPVYVCVFHCCCAAHTRDKWKRKQLRVNMCVLLLLLLRYGAPCILLSDILLL